MHGPGKQSSHHYLRMQIGNDAARTYTNDEPTPPALCLGTPVPRQNKKGNCVVTGVAG